MAKRKSRGIPDAVLDSIKAERWVDHHVDGVDIQDDRTQHAIYTFIRFATNALMRGSIRIYRVIRVPQQEGVLAIQKKNLGRSWSWDLRGVDVYNSVPYSAKARLVDVVLVVEVPTSVVDWLGSLESNAIYAGEQYEVDLEPNQDVALLAVYPAPPSHGGWGRSASLSEADLGVPFEVFDPPVLANSGSASEAWRAANRRRRV